jgi:hypothetical protein
MVAPRNVGGAGTPEQFLKQTLPCLLLLYVVRPPGVPGSLNFQPTSAAGYDLDGDTMAVAPRSQYFF